MSDEGTRSCPNCGRSVLADHKFCTDCGSSLGATRRFETERSTDAAVAEARTIRSESTTRALSVEELRQQILSDLEFLTIPDHYLRTAFDLNIVAGFSLDHRLQFVSINRVPVDARMKVRLDDYKTLLLSYEAMLSLMDQRGNQRGQSDFSKGFEGNGPRCAKAAPRRRQGRNGVVGYRPPAPRTSRNGSSSGPPICRWLAPSVGTVSD